MPLEPQVLDGSSLAALVELERVSQTFPLSSTQLKSALTEGGERVFGLLASGQLLGYAHLSRQPFEAELQSLLVAPQARRRGLAEVLMSAVIGQAKAWKSERLLLEVRQSNGAAISLYRRLGFSEDGRRSDYYPSLDGAGREDALLMSRPLQGA